MRLRDLRLSDNRSSPQFRPEISLYAGRFRLTRPRVFLLGTFRYLPSPREMNRLSPGDRIGLVANCARLPAVGYSCQEAMGRILGRILWAAISLAAAFSMGVVARNQGEPVNTTWL